MRIRPVLIIAAAMSGAGPALAEGETEAMSYSYIQAGLLGGDFRSAGESTGGDGSGLDSSFEFGSHVFMSLDSSSIAYIDSGLGLRLQSNSIGLGAHAALGERIDVLGGFSLEAMNFKQAGVAGSNTESGWGANVGLRGKIGEKFQWTTGVEYRDVGDFKSSVGITVGGHFYLSTAFALGLRVSSWKYDQDTLDAREWISSVDFRYHFRKD